jgi:hypothetical protein
LSIIPSFFDGWKAKVDGWKAKVDGWKAKVDGWKAKVDDMNDSLSRDMIMIYAKIFFCITFVDRLKLKRD